MTGASYSFIITYVLIGMYFFFFFNDTATTEIYTLSLHDALPISGRREHCSLPVRKVGCARAILAKDRKSTRLNSSHVRISYAVFCLKKKNLLSLAAGAGSLRYHQIRRGKQKRA